MHVGPRDVEMEGVTLAVHDREGEGLLEGAEAVTVCVKVGACE